MILTTRMWIAFTALIALLFTTAAYAAGGDPTNTMAVGMLLLGWVSHIVKKLIEAKTAEGKPISPIDYFASKPYKTLASVIATVVAYLGAVAMMEPGAVMAPMTAFLLGVAGDSAAGVFGKAEAKTA